MRTLPIATAWKPRRVSCGFRTNENVTETTYLIGPQIYIIRPARTFRPYAKFLIGEGKLAFPFGYAQGGYLAYAPGGGVDMHLSDRWTARLVDFEYQLWPKFTYGDLKPYGVSAGLSFRLNAVHRFPGRDRYKKD